MKVMIIIDMLNDFCPNGALPVKEGDTIVPLINKLMLEGGFDLILAVNDAHPEGHKSFASSHPNHKVFETIDLNGVQQTLWPDHCIPGTWGSNFHSELDTSKIQKIFKKGTDLEVDSYSAFFDNAKLKETELRSYLVNLCTDRGIDSSQLKLYFCGLALDYCVKFSAIDAKQLGFQSSVIYDATRSVNLSPYDEMKALHELECAGVELLVSSKINPEKALAVNKEIGLMLHG